MRNEGGGAVLAERERERKRNVFPRAKLSAILRLDWKNDEDEMNRPSNASMESGVTQPSSGESSPLVMSLWNHPSSPFCKSPWTRRIFIENSQARTVP